MTTTQFIIYAKTRTTDAVIPRLSIFLSVCVCVCVWVNGTRWMRKELTPPPSGKLGKVSRQKERMIPYY